MNYKALIITLYLRARWLFECLICRSKIRKHIISIIPDGNIIVLMPHSDDEWIGCSQLLINNPSNTLVVNMDMNGGDNYNLHKIRLEESTMLAKEIGYSLFTVRKDYRFQDLSKILKEYEPAYVFIPSYFDWHNEHFEVMNAFSKAADKINYQGNVGMYQVSVPIPSNYINAGSAMDIRGLYYKWKLFCKSYPTQSNIPIFRFAANEIINGGISGGFAMEAYSIDSYDKWKEKHMDNCLTEEEKQTIKNNINNIKRVRCFCEMKSQQDCKIVK